MEGGNHPQEEYDVRKPGLCEGRVREVFIVAFDNLSASDENQRNREQPLEPAQIPGRSETSWLFAQALAPRTTKTSNALSKHAMARAKRANLPEDSKGDLGNLSVVY